MQVKHQHQKLNICKWWLDRGFYLLPAQTGKKYLLQGWGEYKNKITNFDSAVHLWDCKQSTVNLAVLARDGHCILDFDNPDLYTFWANKHQSIAHTYTERTPRGGAHVFFRSAVPPGLVLVPGAEIKKIVLIHPSRIEGGEYTRGEGEIIEADASLIFSSLSKPGTRTAYVLSLEKRRAEVRPSSGLIDQIKAHWSTVQVFQTYVPEIEFRGNGITVSARCPFHKDRKPSMFVNTETGYWKCHACGAYGDVINAYARLEGITNREAIFRMSSALGVKA